MKPHIPLSSNILNRFQPPAIQSVDQVHVLNPVEHSLRNGIPVYFMKGGALELSRVEFIFKVGSFDQPAPLVSFATANMLKRGTKDKSASQISNLLDFYGASLMVDAEKDITTIGVLVLNKHLKPVLELLAEMLSAATFPEDELQTYMQNKKQRHVVNNQKVQYIARSAFGELIFGTDHPYGISLKEEDFDGVQRNQLLAFYENFQPGKGICMVSGNYPDNIDALLNEIFGAFPCIPTAFAVRPELGFVSTSEKKHYLHREHAVQSAFRVGKQMIDRQDPDYARVLITNAMLGGYFGSRLMQNIRQDKGYTYGISSAVISLFREGYFFISSQVGTTVCQAALDEVYLELRRLRQEPAHQDELHMLKNYLSGSFLRSFDGPFAQMERFKETLLLDLKANHHQAFLQTLKDCTAEELMQTAEQYFHEKDMIELVVGKK